MRTPRTSTPEATTDNRFASFGAALLLLALVAIVTGIVLLPFYHATAEGAHASVQAMNGSLPLRILRGVHHWASALLILLGGAYLVWGAFTCAYRRPRQVAWVAAVGLVLLFFAFQLTGHLLPWDSQAVSTAAIETGVAANAPVVGPMQAKVMRGGTDAVSPDTLKAWYIAHIALLPLALLAAAGLFMSQLRRAGDRLTLPRGAVAVKLAALVVAAVALQPPLGRAATPQDYNSFSARAEWYTLPLHALLGLAQKVRPDLAFIGTMVIPGMAVLLLLALPWLDRRRSGEAPSSAVRGCAALGVAGALVLVLLNLGHMEPILGPHRVEANSGEDGGQNPAQQVKLDPALVKKGQSLFAGNGCAGCHKVGGQGGAVGPPLDGEGARKASLDWQVKHLKDPSSVTPGSTMPPYKQLSDADLKALAMYLVSLK